MLDARSHRGLERRVGALLVMLAAVAPSSPAIEVSASQTPVTYADDFSGFAMTAPRGWRRVRDGELNLPKGARAGFLDARGEMVVYVVIELVPGGVIPQNDRSLDEYVERVTAKAAAASGVARPTPCRVAGRRALRTETRFTANGIEVLNTATYTNEGYLYFMVGSFADVRQAQRAAAIHESFERAVAISKTSIDVNAALSASIASSIPYLDAEGVQMLTRAVFDRIKTFDSAEATTLSYTIVSLGLELLPVADLATCDVLHAKALRTLPENDRAFLLRTNAEIVAGRTVSREDQEHSFRLFRRAYATLTPAELATLGRLAREYVRLGIAAYDASP